MEKIRKYSISIIDDEPDILTLYSDYLSKKGHTILCRYPNSAHVLEDIDRDGPDGYIMDYKLVGKMDGIEIAIEILKKYPTRFIIFITGFELLEQEILKHDIFFQKKIDVLIKPVKLRQIENSILNVMQHL